MAIERVLKQPTFDQELAEKIRNWARSSSRFLDFLQCHEKKIARKLGTAKESDDQRDVGAELFTARMFLHAGSKIVPEPQSKGPDFLVTVSGGSFYVEVARIRETRLQEQWDNIVEGLSERVRPFCKDVVLKLDVIPFEPGGFLLHLLEGNFERIVQELQGLASLRFVTKLPKKLKSAPTRSFRIQIEPTTPGGGAFEFESSPFIYSGDEHRKFGDILCRKVRQLVTGSPNIIYVRVNSSTHQKGDFRLAKGEIDSFLSKSDVAFFKNKGFTDTEDFRVYLRRLTTFVVEDMWCSGDSDDISAYVWENPTAEHRLSEAARKVLMTAVKVRWN